MITHVISGLRRDMSNEIIDFFGLLLRLGKELSADILGTPAGSFFVGQMIKEVVRTLSL
jgi:hypothetical protein